MARLWAENSFQRHEHFERLKVFLLGQTDAPYAALAREMTTSEGALKVAIHRLRKRYRELFRQEIADTVGAPTEVEGSSWFQPESRGVFLFRRLAVKVTLVR